MKGDTFLSTISSPKVSFEEREIFGSRNHMSFSVIMMTIRRGEKTGNFKGCDSYYGLCIRIDAWIYIMVKLTECTTHQNYVRIYCSATFK